LLPSEGLLAIEIGLQTGRDFTTQAAEAHKALQLRELLERLRATGGHRLTWGKWIAHGLLLWPSMGVRKILYDCCCAATAMLRQAGTHQG
jgi:hypothetical protein